MNGPRRTPLHNPNADALTVFGLLLIVVLIVAGAWAAAELAHLAEHTAAPQHNPVGWVKALVKGAWHWPSSATWWAAGEAAVVLALALVIAVPVMRWQAKRVYVDTRARLLGRDRPSLRRYIDPKAAPVAAEHGAGLQIGRDVLSGRMVRATWEDTMVVIAGARMGKTTSMAVPQVLDAPGAVYCTSNKRDLYDSTARARRRRGEVWLFDPQGIAGTERPSFWWDPLDSCRTIAAARRTADVFATASRPPNASRDAYFDPASEELLASYLLAAAAGGEPVTAVHAWLANSRDETPVHHLRAAGHDALADAADATMRLPDRQLAGVVGTAAKVVAWMADPRLRAWVTDPGDGRPRLDVAKVLAARHATLHSLSKEGEGSAGALTGALTTTFLTEAERVGQASPAGRLPVPVVAVLDEVANVCRWRDLPDRYSHYGSRGIICACYLQSWSQGVDCWGREGMRKLWGAANIRVYGGGTHEAEFLEDVSRICGDWDAPATSLSTARGGNGTAGARTYTASTKRERILDVSTLGALPASRAVVMLSGTYPLVVRKVAWHHNKAHKKAMAEDADGPTLSTPAPAELGRPPAQASAPAQVA
jgi:type IV secretory pathway TraG/TraD family ATPase VirD4